LQQLFRTVGETRRTKVGTPQRLQQQTVELPDLVDRQVLGADQLATSANREPRVVLFYATDDDAAEATAQRLISAAGFEPLKVGGVSDAGRIEGPDGELQGRIFDLDEARATIATEGVKT